MEEKVEDRADTHRVPSYTAAEQSDGALPAESRSDSDPKTAAGHSAQHPEHKKPSKLKQLWTFLGLDALTLMQMFKASLPPTIAIAIYQAKGIQDVYSTLGYLVAIISVLSLCIMPRGKFLQNLACNVTALCLAGAVNLLALYCSTTARLNTTPPGPPSASPTYNASASTVCAIWLIFQTYLINAIRAARPQLQFPTIIYSIFTTVILTYGVLFPNMAYAISFVERIMEAFLTGMGIATAVHFVVFPLSSRTVVMKEWTGYFMLLSGSLKTQLGYMASLSTVDPVKLRKQHEEEDEAEAKLRHKRKHHTRTHSPLETPESLKYTEVRQKLLELHSKIEGDITPAKREIALGKLESHDLTHIWKLMKFVFLPVIGLGSMISILDRNAELRGWDRTNGTEEEMQEREHQIHRLHFILTELRDPFAKQIANIEGAIQHVMLTLELTKPPKKQKVADEESAADSSAKPGTTGFAEAYKKEVDEFYASKEKTLRDWCHEHDVELPHNFFETKQPHELLAKDENMRQVYQRQLFFTLFLEYLLWRASSGMLDLVLYVDKRKQDGILKRSRIIFPGSKTIYKWIKATFGQEDISQEDSYVADWDASGSQAAYLGEDFTRRKDPEHLPPRNTQEKIGDAIRTIPRLLRSEESVHGARVAAATMTIGVVCYIRPTQDFFIKQRFLWAMIMIAISMTRTAGQSIQQFGFRILGTAIAMIMSYVVWYIVDGHTAGVIVFLWLWIFLAFWIVVKKPEFAILGILSLVTVILIVGYELQVKAVGVAVVEANGQPAYPIYILAPYRLATVIVGLAVAFIWTFFPFPVSESSMIRRDLSAALYLMCSYHSIVHETIKSRVQNTSGDPSIKGTHAYNLEKARLKVFAHLLALVQRLKMNSAFSKFQLQIGGRFPRETYIELINCVQRLGLWTSLASYSSSTLQVNSQEGKELSQWSSDFRQLTSHLSVNSNKTTSLLALLSSSLMNAQPLPPYLEHPEPLEFVKMIESVDRDILSIRHIAEPEYSAFAVLQIVSQSVGADLAQLVSLAKDLVGEIDFSFHALYPSSKDSVASDTDSTDNTGKVQ